MAASAVLTASEVHELKKAPGLEGVLPAIHERWSARSFDERTVSEATLKKVFEAARRAPSSRNEHPVLVVGTTATKFSKRGAENRFALYDLGAATSYLTLEAATLGLTTHQMGGFDQEAARKALAIPAEYAIGAVVALGCQGEPAVLGDQTLIEREMAGRTRKPLGEIVFSEWGQPAKL